MAYKKSFNEILNELLQDHLNQDPTADISKGSMIFMTSAAKAAAVWGLYFEISYQAQQIFPDSADREHLEHHATVHGLQLVPGESDSGLLARVLEHIRRPPAGGNRYDYVRWAKEITGVLNAWTVNGAQGPGTTDLVVLADAALTGSEIPDAELLAKVRAHIVDLCPNDVKYFRALPPEVLLQDVTITRSGASYPEADAEDDITTYLSTLLPGQTLYQGQLVSLALGGGEGDAVATTPPANVVPTGYQMIRPGAINVI